VLAIAGGGQPGTLVWTNTGFYVRLCLFLIFHACSVRTSIVVSSGIVCFVQETGGYAALAFSRASSCAIFIRAIFQML
jgi:hypothetical protein